MILGLDNAGKTVRVHAHHCHVYIQLILILSLSPTHTFNAQTFLEKTKQLFVRNYSGMPLEKITSTVGLNGISR